MPRDAKEGRLDGCEVFLYTEHQTAEIAYFREWPKAEPCLR
jgi:hypothetical protein